MWWEPKSWEKGRIDAEGPNRAYWSLKTELIFVITYELRVRVRVRVRMRGYVDIGGRGIDAEGPKRAFEAGRRFVITYELRVRVRGSRTT